MASKPAPWNTKDAAPVPALPEVPRRKDATRYWRFDVWQDAVWRDALKRRRYKAMVSLELRVSIGVGADEPPVCKPLKGWGTQPS